MIYLGNFGDMLGIEFACYSWVVIVVLWELWGFERVGGNSFLGLVSNIIFLDLLFFKFFRWRIMTAEESEWEFWVWVEFILWVCVFLEVF